MNDNIVDMSGKILPSAPLEAVKPKPRTFFIQTTFSEEPMEATGFLGVTPSFVAVALDDGNIEMVVPLENLVFARAKPESATATYVTD